MTRSAWWRRAFAGAYLDVYAHRDDRAAAEEIAGLLPALARVRGPILDAGCGGGRHLASLRAAGLLALGLDQSADLLAHARTRPTCRGHLIRADLLAPPLARAFGAVLLLFTSFGYGDDQENAMVFARLAGLLAPGGLLLLDLPDPVYLRRHLVASSERRSARGELIQERRFWAGRRLQKEVHFRGASWTESVRIYDAEEIAGLAQHAGLACEARWSSLRAPTQPDHRLVHWLRAPG